MMAEQEFRDLLGLVAMEMRNLSTSVVDQGISQVVQTFDGQPKNFREWIQSIEKYGRLRNLPDARLKLVAFQSSKGVVSGCIQRFITNNDQMTWGELKRELSSKFSDVNDAHHAMSVLRSMKQGHGENIQSFAEKLMAMAEIAFNGQGGQAVDRQLVDIFVDGLSSDTLKLTILRRNPDNLQGAINIATTEQNLKKRVGLSGRYEHHDKPTPMEVDHSRPLKCFKCKRFGHSANKCRSVNSVANEITCWTCGEKGHISRFCKTEKRDKLPMGHGRGFTFNKLN